MDSKRIAIVMLEQQAPQKEILKGLLPSLHEQLRIEALDTFIPRVPTHNELSVLCSQIVEKEYDLIYAIGAWAALAAKAATEKRRHRIPVIFIAVLDPVKIGLIASTENSGNHLTGVSVNPVSHVLPAQLIWRLNPNLKKLLIAYKVEKEDGRTEHNVHAIQTYLHKYHIEVEPLRLAENDVIGEQQADLIQQFDAVLVPEAGLPKEDIEALTQLCNEHKVFLYADGKEALEQGALIGFAADMQFMGAKAAQAAGKLFKERKLPSEIPVYVVENSRRLVVNTQKMAEQGISHTDELLCSLEQLVEKHEIKTRAVAMLLPEIDAYDWLKTITYRRAVLEKGIYYAAPTFEGDRSRPELFNYCLTKPLTYTETKLVLAYGEEFAQDALATMRQKQVDLPFMSVVITDQQPSAEPEVVVSTAPVFRVHLEPVLATLPLALLLQARSTMKSTALVTSLRPHEWSVDFKERIEKARVWCALKNIVFQMMYEDELDHWRDNPEQCPVETFFTYEQYQHTHMMWRLHDLCKRAKILACAGGLRWFGRFPIVYGFDKAKLEKHLFDPIHDLLEHHKKPEPVVFLPVAQTQSILLNQELCERYGVDFSPELAQMLGCSMHLIKDSNPEPDTEIAGMEPPRFIPR